MNLKNIVFLDIEVFPNYWLIMVYRLHDGKVVGYDLSLGEVKAQQRMSALTHLLSKYTVVTFNGIKYDTIVYNAIAQGYNHGSIYDLSKALVESDTPHWDVAKEYGVSQYAQYDHIDIMELCPLVASLKTYGGRIHSPKLQDLPLPPHEPITKHDINDIRTYCRNDLLVTSLVFNELIYDIELRITLGDEYGLDLRSKSDAQIAEAVIKSEIESITGSVPKAPQIPAWTEYRYSPPDDLQFNTKTMLTVFNQFKTKPFILKDTGKLMFDFDFVESDRIKSGKNAGNFPKSKSKYKFTFGGLDTVYTVGIGGLHSCEKSITHDVSDGHIIRDYDVASYYPMVILNNELFPKHIGPEFLHVYSKIVHRRLRDKAAGNTRAANSLKIVINGSYGKFGSQWSALFSPDLIMQTTVTGQLSLLMLIERLELSNINVVSANTDGIVVKMQPEQSDLADEIVSDWEFDTNYTMESTDYVSIHSRDINNYIAIKEDGIKGKGAFALQSDPFYRLRSNPTNEICKKAVMEYLRDNVPVADTIHGGQNIRDFLTLRKVDGGAEKDGVNIGKSIRWYYRKNDTTPIKYVRNGNKVPKSDGAYPIMTLDDDPDVSADLPSDINYDHYVAEATKMLRDLGVNV